ncbi:hypothetical protein RRG08_060157 [Elysia crispata]|uniref:Uncharacterized protein n=1 Tax=Elysia crispata TaxID=231223 RepID=A0AAE1DQ80_9GAST|nr:hypothetical protein RRG08_060157 [Elysia crispata]
MKVPLYAATVLLPHVLLVLWPRLYWAHIMQINSNLLLRYWRVSQQTEEERCVKTALADGKLLELSTLDLIDSLHASGRPRHSDLVAKAIIPRPSSSGAEATTRLDQNFQRAVDLCRWQASIF